MTDKKPREWLIRPDGDGAIHVVEISALLEAQAEIARLKIIADEFHKRAGMGITRWSEVMNQNGKLREALEKIRAQNTGWTAVSIARAALNEPATEE